eukprot:Em0002g1507a
MGNAEAKEAKYATVTDRSDGEGCKGAREERSGETDYSKLPCLSEQSKTISFNVLLLCAPHNTTNSRTFTTTKFPESVAALKLAIQEEFQVPVYDQKLSFGSTVMADCESLDFYRLKDGDQITLEYTTTVDVECAFHLMSLLRNALEFVKNEQNLIGALMKVAERTSSHPIQLEDMDPELCLKLESDLVMYFGVMVISHLALIKAALLPEQLSSQVEFFLTRFLRSVDCSVLHTWMVKTRGFRWQDIFPTVRLVYSPLCRASLCPIDLLCFEAGVCSLHIILSRDDEMQTLIKQGLLDYLICLPWHISEGLEARKKAKLLLEKVGSHMPLQPPSLNNIVRSKLAATCCGLTKAIRYDCHQLVDYCQKTSTEPYKEQIQMDK